MIDWVSTVIAIVVFGVAVVVAYARGYRAGHDDGFTEAVMKIQRYTERGFD